MVKPIKSLTDNLAEPLLFTEADALKFAKRNVCIDCEGLLQPKYVSYDRFNIVCVLCGKVLMEGEYIDKGKLPLLHQSRLIGQREMRDEPKERKTTEEILKELGY